MSWIEQSWQTRGLAACLLWPLSLLYAAVLRLRSSAYRSGRKKPAASPLPVVVVGNLSVGGTGKTPLLAHLVQTFQSAGWKPAIVSRGYGGEGYRLPHRVMPDDTAAQVGDEPLMLSRQTAVPVCVCINRAAAVAELALHTDADIVFSDDGLQHLAMAREVDIVVMDAAKGLGNRWMLPAGPLRDHIDRLAASDLIVLQQAPGVELHASLNCAEVDRAMAASPCSSSLAARFSLSLISAINLNTGEIRSLKYFAGKTVHAVAGIGNPERFFNELRRLGINVVSHPMSDHHAYTAGDFKFRKRKNDPANELGGKSIPILVTAKDAVKLRGQSWLADSVYEVTTELLANDALYFAIENLEFSLRKSVGAEINACSDSTHQ